MKRAIIALAAIVSFNGYSQGQSASQDVQYYINDNVLDVLPNYGQELAYEDIESHSSDLVNKVVNEENKIKKSVTNPKPVNGFLKLESKGGVFEKIEVYNAIGKRVYSGPFTHLLYVGNLPAGMYIIKSNSDKGMSSVRFVKQ